MSSGRTLRVGPVRWWEGWTSDLRGFQGLLLDDEYLYAYGDGIAFLAVIMGFFGMLGWVALGLLPGLFGPVVFGLGLGLGVVASQEIGRRSAARRLAGLTDDEVRDSADVVIPREELTLVEADLEDGLFQQPTVELGTGEGTVLVAAGADELRPLVEALEDGSREQPLSSSPRTSPGPAARAG